MSLFHSTLLRRRRLIGVLAAAALVTAPMLATTTNASAATAPGGGSEIRPYEPGEDAVAPDVKAPKSNAPSHVPARDVPKVNGLPVTGTTGVSRRIAGLTMQDQRTSNGGNSFSIEPPDQGLCVGNGRVIEAVNNVFAIYQSGVMQGSPQSFDPFWNNGTAEIDRTNAPNYVYGPFVSDPKCYYDPGTGRFFMTELQLGTDPTTGDFTGDSFENVAVSKTSTPTTSAADWYLYRLNVRNDGTQGTPDHTGCPCQGDQPLIGADRYGFYVSTNESPLFQSGFNGAQLYAFDKVALTNGVMRVQRLESNGLPLAEGVAYSVQPATSPTATQWSGAANGTEYFLSALEFTGGFDNRIATWALTNTKSLATQNPAVHLSYDVVGSEVYGLPPQALQKIGPTPLADAVHAKEEMIASNDDRMNQVVYAHGKLWSGLNTAVKTPVGPATAGIAYFVVSPSVSHNQVAGTMSHQGYVAVNGNSTIFPAIGVNPNGSAVMTFSLTGKGYYPSAAIVHLGPNGGLTSGVQRLAAGVVPDDGFSGYPAYGGAGVGRWGDYSAAVSDGAGKVWVATEYIPGTFGYPPYLANWGTYVASVTP